MAIKQLMTLSTIRMIKSDRVFLAVFPFLSAKHTSPEIMKLLCFIKKEYHLKSQLSRQRRRNFQAGMESGSGLPLQDYFVVIRC
jgi:hypothetical protein